MKTHKSCSTDGCIYIHKHDSTSFIEKVPPPSLLSLHQSFVPHEAYKQKPITIFMSNPDDKWKQEQRKEQNPFFIVLLSYWLSFHLQLFSHSLWCSFASRTTLTSLICCLSKKIEMKKPNEVRFPLNMKPCDIDGVDERQVAFCVLSCAESNLKMCVIFVHRD